MSATRQGIRERLRGRAPLIGTFIKTGSHQIPEILGAAGLDFGILDAEHAPFDLPTLDTMVVAARAAGLPCLVRVATADAGPIGQVLDLGADGVVVPHVATAAAARAVLGAAKFAAGQRGYSPSTRAAGYGAGDTSRYAEEADRRSLIWCQIEDAAALAQLGEIAAIDAIDCLFLGRADLARSLGVARTDDPQVLAAVRATAEVGRRYGRVVGIHVGSTREIPALLELGISVFACGSDQSLLLAEGRRLCADLAAATVATQATQAATTPASNTALR